MSIYIILWPEVQSHSDNSYMHATVLRSARALAQARPTMSCIHLVIITYVYMSSHEGGSIAKSYFPRTSLTRLTMTRNIFLLTSRFANIPALVIEWAEPHKGKNYH